MSDTDLKTVITLLIPSLEAVQTCPHCDACAQVAKVALDAIIKAGKGICDCGHAKHDHIYEEGACRPGFLCANECLKYEAKS